MPPGLHIAPQGPAGDAVPGLLLRFDSPDAVAGWRAIDDRVMGGVSCSRLRHDAAGHAVFEGRLSLDFNGGFASVRSAPAAWGQAGATELVLLVLGDGRRYKLSLFTDDGFDSISHQAGFQPPGGAWTRVRLPLPAFQATRRGRPIAGPALDLKCLRQIGLVIADRQAGEFALSLRWMAVA